MAKRRGLKAALGLLPESIHQHALAAWESREADLYVSFAAGKINRDEYRHQRFAMLLPDEKNDETKVEAMNTTFMFEVNDNIGLIDGAAECLQELHSMGLRCHLLTNGPVDGQQRKIDRLKLARWFHYIQIGEAVGVFKPDPQAFKILLNAIQKPAKSVVMVGDSLHDDIEAAKSVGVAAIHFNKSGQGEVASLKDVPEAIANVSHSDLD